MSKIQEVERIWDVPIRPELQASVDRVLDYMIMRGLSPVIKVSGNIIESAQQIAEQFPPYLPSHLQEDARSLVDYLLHWIADYADETNATYMNLSLRLTNQRGVV